MTLQQQDCTPSTEEGDFEFFKKGGIEDSTAIELRLLQQKLLPGAICKQEEGKHLTQAEAGALAAYNLGRIAAPSISPEIDAFIREVLTDDSSAINQLDEFPLGAALLKCGTKEPLSVYEISLLLVYYENARVKRS